MVGPASGFAATPISPRPMRRKLVEMLRSFLRHAGIEVLHHTDDPVLQSLMAARETLRVSPNLPPWRSDSLLSQVAALAHVRNLLRSCAINLVVDIGANKGQFAQSVRRLGYAGRIVSFEPLADAHAALHAAAGGDPAWQVHRLALGDMAAELPLNVYRDTVFSSLHTANSAGQSRFSDLLALDHIETVPVRTLDSVASDLLPTDSATRILLKTDTQGHDLAVLQGARATLTRTAAVITEASISPIYEGSPTYLEIIRFLVGAGFKPSGIYPISHDDRDFSLIEVDCCFVRSPLSPQRA